MNLNEPVAWVYRIKDTDNRWELTWNKPTTKELFDTEPLYTHPVKELTDEEIITLWNDLVDRTILRKAKEK